MKPGLSFLLFLLMLVPGRLLSQEITVRGFVGVEGQAIEGCTITLGDMKLKTDSSGNFLMGVKPGRNKLIISATGYETWSKNIHFNADTSLVIELREESAQMGEIVVT